MADEVLDAELVPSKVVLTELESEEDIRMRADRRELNQVLGATVAIVIVALLLSRIITAPLEEDLDDGGWGDEFPPIWERYLADFNTNESHSFVLQNGTLTGPDGALLWSGYSPFRGVRTSYL